MAEQLMTESGWRVIRWAGLGDIGVGFVMAAVGFADLVGDNGRAVGIVGLVLVGTGVLIAGFAHSKLNRAEDRRGDMN